MEVTIRRGRNSDVPAALCLIKELAEYERAPHEVEVTLEEMVEWGFGSQKVYEFFVAEKDGKVIGMALYYYKYSTWKGKCLFLEDLIVTGSERCKGYGSMLMNHVIAEAKSQKVRRLEWQVLHWNAPAIEFYKKFNSSFDDEWLNCRLTPDRF
jgi:GNAT superfamily N-acetyltransferase